MPKKSVAKNYIYNVIYQILTIIIPLITTPYLSRVLGAKQIGIYSYTISITTYFVLFGSLGFAMYGQREIAYVQDDVEKRSKSFFEIFFIKLITQTLSAIIFYYTFCKTGEYSAYYKILLLEIIANILDINWFFQGLEEFKKTILRSMIIRIISIICIFIFIKSKTDLSKYIIIYVLSTFIGSISLWFYLPKYISKIKFKNLNFRKHIKPAIKLFIPQIATQVYTVLDKTMIGVIVENKAEVGYYEQAQKIVKLLMTLATSLGTVMMPRIANTYINGEKKKMKEYMNNSFSFIMMMAFPLMFGIISISKKFVPLFYGEGYDKVIYLINTISPIIVLIGLSNVIGTQYLLPTKQQKKFTITVILGALTNVILNILLIPRWKSIGASIATVIAELTVTAAQFVLVKNEFKIKNVIQTSYKYIISSSIMFICSILIANIITNNVLSIIIQILCSTTIYFIILLILKDKMLLYIINKIKPLKGTTK